MINFFYTGQLEGSEQHDWVKTSDKEPAKSPTFLIATGYVCGMQPIAAMEMMFLMISKEIMD